MNSTLTFICMLWSILMCAHVPLHTYLDTYLHTLRQSHLHIFLFYVHNNLHFIFFYITFSICDGNAKISL